MGVNSLKRGYFCIIMCEGFSQLMGLPQHNIFCKQNCILITIVTMVPFHTSTSKPLPIPNAYFDDNTPHSCVATSCRWISCTYRVGRAFLIKSVLCCAVSVSPWFMFTYQFKRQTNTNRASGVAQNHPKSLPLRLSVLWLRLSEGVTFEQTHLACLRHTGLCLFRSLYIFCSVFDCSASLWLPNTPDL